MSSAQVSTAKLSFGRQIILLITVTVISLAVIGSITAAYFINERISNIVLEQGRQITGTLAHQSILPLLSRMPDIAKEDVNATLQYPNVQAIVIYDQHGSLLVNTGYDEAHEVNSFPNNTAPFEVILLRETEDAWEFMATVYDIDVAREEPPSLDELFVRTPQLIGYVVIQVDKSELYKIQGELLLDNLYIFLGVGALMLAISILVSRQMTTPLNQLARLMGRAEKGEEGIRSVPEGPVETHSMARAFNTMMDALEQRQAYVEEQHQSLLREITERQVVEQSLRDSERNLKEARDAALESAHIKSEFLANMSHEIRTPMNGMLGMMQLLSDSPLSSEQRGFVDTALRSTEQLLNIINDILDFSKIEAGKLQLARVEFSPRAVVSDVIKLFTPKCQQKNIGISLNIADEVPALIMGDPTKLNQIISNLVGNAVKFTDEGYINVSCRFRAGYLTLEVKDSGIGIEPDAHKTIFDSFIQADGSSTRRYSGTGLGLAIVRQLVELMAGNIELSSVPDEGSTFTITLPVEAIAPQQESSDNNTQMEPFVTSEKNKSIVNTGQKTHILVVEDNKTNQRVITTMLGKLGYQPEVVDNGKEALSRLLESRYALIFMDCQMPVMDGYQTTRLIREMVAKGEIDYLIRIVAMTGNALEGERERCMEAGMDDYIAKPVRLSLLKKVLENASNLHAHESPHKNHRL